MLRLFDRRFYHSMRFLSHPLLELESLFSSRIIVYFPRCFSVRLRISPRPSFATRLRGPPQRRQRYYTFLGDTYRRSGACAIVWAAICDCWKNHCPRCVRRRLDRAGPSSSCPASMSFSHPRHSYPSATWSRLATGRPRYIDVGYKMETQYTYFSSPTLYSALGLYPCAIHSFTLS